MLEYGGGGCLLFPKRVKHESKGVIKSYTRIHFGTYRLKISRTNTRFL